LPVIIGLKVYSITNSLLSDVAVTLTVGSNILSGTTNSGGEVAFNLGNVTWSVGDIATFYAYKVGEGEKSQSITLSSQPQQVSITLVQSSNLSYYVSEQERYNLVFSVLADFEGNKITDINPLPTSAMLKDVNGSLAEMDRATNVLSVITYEHHEIHSGTHYIYRCYANLLKAGVKEYLIVTPSGTKWCHMIIGFEIVTSQTVVQWFEKVTTSDNGTLANTNNRNRNFADNNTTKIYEDPTVTGGAVAGNLIQCGIFGAGRGSAGGAARDNEEIVLAPNTKYLVRFTEQNLAATAINFFADWYEHTNKN